MNHLAENKTVLRLYFKTILWIFKNFLNHYKDSKYWFIESKYSVLSVKKNCTFSAGFIAKIV